MTMQTISTFLIALLTLTVNQAKDPFDLQVASVIILQDKAVQKEIKVTEAQRAAMNKAADLHRDEMERYQKELESKQKDKTKPLNVDASRMDSMFLAMKQNVFATLNGTQLKRLREISLQQLDFVALIDPAVAQKLGLTVTQKKKMAADYQKGIEKVDDLAKTMKAQLDMQTADLVKQKPKTEAEAKKLDAEFEKRANALKKRYEPQVEAIRAQSKKSLMGALTAAQTTAWKSLLGKPFKA